MTKKIENKSLLGKRTIEFDEKEVRVSVNHYFVGKRTRQYRLDEISHRYEYQSINYSAHGCLILVIIGFIVLWGLIVDFDSLYLVLGLLIIAGLLIIPNRIMREQMIEIKTKNEPISLYINIKNEKKGIEFVNQLIQASKEYLTKKYGYVDADLQPEKQFENYRWLLQNDIIPEEKYQELKNHLKEKLKK